MFFKHAILLQSRKYGTNPFQKTENNLTINVQWAEMQTFIAFLWK